MNPGRSAALASAAVLCGLPFLLAFGLTVLPGGAAGLPLGCDPAQPAASGNADQIPADYLALYRKAGQEYGLPWNVLAAVGSVESSHGRSRSPGVTSGENYAGAGGPMQFLQATWNAFGVDGNGDGRKDRYDPADAIPAAARYLKHNGAPERMRHALYRYNHSWDYVDLVLARADKLTVANPLGGDCSADVPLSAPAKVRTAIAWALKQLGTPYQFGGACLDPQRNPTNPIRQNCDCSSLMEQAWKRVGVTLPRVAADQARSAATRSVPRHQIAPGDLVFRPGYTEDPDNPGHVGMYIGGGKVVHAPSTGDVVKVDSYAANWVDKVCAIRRIII